MSTVSINWKVETTVCRGNVVELYQIDYAFLARSPLTMKR
jgi:hypothetical protein